MNQEVSRTKRVALEVRKTLSEILHRETKDPRLSKVNITECKISKDLSVVTVYFTIIGQNEADQAAQDAIRALEKAKGFFRTEIGKRMNLRITPEVRFFYDTVAENASHIEELIFQALHKKDEYK
ncbi:30S ribosome-binding factor RbfA [Hydrogenovibrio sp. JE_KL2]|uniref:30S ribosome-binding factor RbfA n=1 Tax=Hydrogenovibrio sp. JE_KL2 TaxID=2651188 RepID=UPI00128DFFCC|nr:30S ribosome-binding factor RbfA [Hydrogenovibrio sp. JE_KL2]MPQ75924.1 30S ribosome-binding factor RbfA [Hydrogenovibrio sp. JE_KL2]